MKPKLVLLLSALLALADTARAQDTAFTYQGRLNNNGAAASGSYDLQFAIFDAAAGGSQIGGALTNNAVAVSNGLFTVTLDFGAGVFSTGADRWLFLSVKSNGVVSFTPLTPRQQITSTPYAITAGNLSGALPNASLSGTYANAVTLNNGANSFSGNGANLTALNASQLASGTVPTAALSNAWRIGGNAGTTPGTQFLGTTDNLPVEFKVNGQRALRLEPNPNAPNVIGGSAANEVTNGLYGAVIAGGGSSAYPNRVGAIFGTVVGGSGNTASGNSATAMGQFNTASGYASTAMGYSSVAGGFGSQAGGTTAKANHDGAFVWADNNFADFTSTAANQFLIRAAGGVGINTNNPHGAALAVNGNVRVNGVIAGDGSGLTNLSLTALGSADPLDIVTSAPLVSPLQYPTGGTLPVSVATGDVNGDGRADLAVANAGSGNVTILTNTGTGFVLAGTITARAGAGAVLLADINRDGYLDVLCANGDNSIAVARGLGNGSFNAATFHAATPTLTRLAVGDLNGDTWPDLVAGARNTNVIPVFLNNGAGNFPANPSSLLSAASNPNAVALAELTGDSNLDLITAHGVTITTSETNVVVYPGNGSGGFTTPINIGTGIGFKTLAVVDMNQDGLKDIIVGMGQSGARIDIFTNFGPGNFTLRQTLPTSYIGSLATGDFNLDGSPDVAVLDGGFFGYSGMRMMLSDGAGRLAQGFHLTPFPYPSVAAGDLNGDGRSELVVPNGGDPGIVNVFSVQAIPGVALTGTTILRGPVTIEQPAAFSAGFTAGGPSTFSSSVTIGGVLSFGSTTRQMINLWGTDYGLGVQSGTHYFRTGSGSTDKFAWYQGGVHSNTSLDPGAGGTMLMSLAANRLFVNGAVGLGTPNPAAKLHLYSTDNPTIMRIQSTGAPGFGRLEFVSNPQGDVNEWRPGYIQSTDNGGFVGGLAFFVNGAGAGNKFGSNEVMRLVNGAVGIGTPTPVSALHVVGTVTATAFNPPSDRNLKENFTPVSPRGVLEKVAAMPISRWNFKGDSATPHVGPMAQDFHAAFGVGTDERHIATVDADGVALAAIQGLNEKVETQNAEIAELKRTLEKLNQVVDNLARTHDQP